MLKDAETECSQRHGREGWIQRADEIFVEPLGFLDLEAYSGDGGEVLLGKVDDEADAEVVQPCARRVSGC